MDPLHNGVRFGKHLLQFAVIEPFFFFSFFLVIDIFFLRFQIPIQVDAHCDLGQFMHLCGSDK